MEKRSSLKCFMHNMVFRCNLNILNLSVDGLDYSNLPFVEKVLQSTASNIIKSSAIGNTALCMVNVNWSGSYQYFDARGGIKKEPDRTSNRTPYWFGGRTGYSGVSFGCNLFYPPGKCQRHLATNARATSNATDDPLMVLESTSSTVISSNNVFIDPLEIIHKVSESGSTNAKGSSTNKGTSDDIDPLLWVWLICTCIPK